MLKMTMRQIRSSFGRFLAIMAIVALGVGFFCGLRLTKTAMVHTLDEYTEEHQMYDFRLVSTLGLQTRSPPMRVWRSAKEKRVPMRSRPLQAGRRSRAASFPCPLSSICRG